MIRFLSSGMLNIFWMPENTGYITSAFPPAAWIFSMALLLNLCARTVSFAFRSPMPSTFSPSFMSSIMPFCFSSSGVTGSVPVDVRKIAQIHDCIFLAEDVGESSFRDPALQEASGRLQTRRPLRRRNGPSGPCVPLPAVLPEPEPGPLPTLFAFFVAPFAGFSSSNLIILLARNPVVEIVCVTNDLRFFHLEKMGNLVDHAANLRRIDANDRMVQFFEAQARSEQPYAFPAGQSRSLPA